MHFYLAYTSKIIGKDRKLKNLCSNNLKIILLKLYRNRGWGGVILPTNPYDQNTTYFIDISIFTCLFVLYLNFFFEREERAVSGFL